MNARILVVGRSPNVLIDTLGILRGKGYSADATNQFDRVLDDYRAEDIDIVVFGGGIVPPDDAVELKRMGVDEVFTPGTSIRDIIEYVERRFGLEKVPAGAR